MSDKLEANTFGLSDDDIDELLQQESLNIDDLLQQDEIDFDELLQEDGDDIEELLEQAESEHDIEELLEQDSHDIDDLLDVPTGDDKQANHYSELVARQWGTPEGEWWP